MRGEITFPFPNLNGTTIDVWEWISNFIPHFTRRDYLSILGQSVRPCAENMSKISPLSYKTAPLKPRVHSGFGFSQWQTTLHCNVVFHWLSPYPEWSLKPCAYNFFPYIDVTWASWLLKSPQLDGLFSKLFRPRNNENIVLLDFGSGGFPLHTGDSAQDQSCGAFMFYCCCWPGHVVEQTHRVAGDLRPGMFTNVSRHLWQKSISWYKQNN